MEKSLCGGLDFFRLALYDLHLARFDCAKAKREVCLGRMFGVHDVLEFGRVCCFSEANYVVMAQTVGP